MQKKASLNIIYLFLSIPDNTKTREWISNLGFSVCKHLNFHEFNCYCFIFQFHERLNHRLRLRMKPHLWLVTLFSCDIIVSNLRFDFSIVLLQLNFVEWLLDIFCDSMIHLMISDNFIKLIMLGFLCLKNWISLDLFYGYNWCFNLNWISCCDLRIH
jgi:hypothetical protein